MIRLSSIAFFVLGLCLLGGNSAEAVQRLHSQGLQAAAATAAAKASHRKSSKTKVARTGRHKKYAYRAEHEHRGRAGRHCGCAHRHAHVRFHEYAGHIGWDNGYYIGDGPYPQWFLPDGTLTGPIAHSA